MCVIKTILAVTNAFIIKAAVLGWILEPGFMSHYQFSPNKFGSLIVANLITALSLLFTTRELY